MEKFKAGIVYVASSELDKAVQCNSVSEKEYINNDKQQFQVTED